MERSIEKHALKVQKRFLKKNKAMSSTNHVIHLNEKDCFVLYHLPGAQEYQFIQMDSANEEPFGDHVFNKKGFIFHPFQKSLNNPPIFIHADKTLINPIVNFEKQSDRYFEAQSKKEYLELAHKFIQETEENFQKLVLSRTLVVENKKQDLFKLFKKMLGSYPDAFIYLFNHPRSGTWMGASPEILIAGHDNKYKSIALAGTRGLNDKNEMPDPWNQKEIDEHQHVVDYIKAQLSKYASKQKNSDPFDSKAGKVVHLRSNFSFEADKTKLPRLIHALHPTPAVCGLPKIKAMEFINNNEKHDRAYYSGYLGPVNMQQDLSLFVNLRCLQLSKSQFVLYLGGGIVSASVAEDEWKETEEKAKTMLDIILQ